MEIRPVWLRQPRAAGCRTEMRHNLRERSSTVREWPIAEVNKNVLHQKASFSASERKHSRKASAPGMSVKRFFLISDFLLG